LERELPAANVKRFIEEEVVNNAALLKALGSHCGAMEKMCEAAASTYKEMSACQKANVDAGLAKATSRDHFMDLHDCYKAAGESWATMKGKCEKAAASGDLEKMVGAVSAAVMSAVDQKYGSLVIPDGGVRKVFQTADPNAVSGLTLVGRSGGPTPPTSLESIPPELRSMVAE
jgi:hypothetical protein